MRTQPSISTRALRLMIALVTVQSPFCCAALTLRKSSGSVMRSANKLPCAVLVLMACGLAAAQEVQLVVQRSPLAGYRYYEAPALAGMLRPGERLDLIREPENPHDANAVRVEWQGRALGYVPRRENRTVAQHMDRGGLTRERLNVGLAKIGVPGL